MSIIILLSLVLSFGSFTKSILLATTKFKKCSTRGKGTVPHANASTQKISQRGTCIDFNVIHKNVINNTSQKTTASRTLKDDSNFMWRSITLANPQTNGRMSAKQDKTVFP